MKKNILNIALALFSICTAFCGTVAAQDLSNPATQSGPKLIVGLTGGLAMPMGNFAATDYSNNNSGYAGYGGNFGITATWFLSKHWGITQLFSYQQFGFSGGQNLTFGMQKSFDVDSVTFNPRGDNHTFSFLIGPTYTTSLGKKLDLDFRLLVGFVNAKLAGNNVTLTDGGVTDPTFYQAVSWANTFGTQAGALIRYGITDHIGVAAGIDFFYSKPNFEVNNINRNNNAGREIYSYNQPVEGINANFSVFYLINHF